MVEPVSIAYRFFLGGCNLNNICNYCNICNSCNLQAGCIFTILLKLAKW